MVRASRVDIGCALFVRSFRHGRCETLRPVRKERLSPADLRIKESRVNVGENDKRRQPMKIGEAAANGEPRYFGVGPFDGEGDWSIAEDAEVIGIVRIFPDVFAA